MISYLVSGITRRSSTAGRDARRFVERRPGGSTRAFEDAGGDIGRSVSRGRDIIPRMAVRIPAILDGPPSMSDEAWANMPEDEPGELVDGALVEKEVPDWI